MAQTIAMQRGTASGSANATSALTLFTNTSSGSGTRVICNMLTCSYSGPYTAGYGYNGTGHLLVLHQSSGGSAQIIGRYAYAYQNNGGLTQTNQFMANSNLAMQFNITPNTGNTPNQQLVSTALNTSNGQGYPTFIPNTPSWNTGSATNLPSSISVQNLTTADSTFYNGSQTYKYYNYMPQNFWIGPSDSIQIKGFNLGYYYSGKSQYSGYQTMSVGYSFTKITES